MNIGRAQNPIKTRLFLCLASALVLGWTGIGVTQPTKVPARQGKVPEEVWQWAQKTEFVRVIVQLHTGVVTTSFDLSQAERQAIGQAQLKLQASLAGMTIYDGRFGPPYKLTGVAGHALRWIGGEIVPEYYMEVGMDALAVLDRSPLVRSVTLWTLLPRGQVPLEVWQKGGGHIIVQLHTGVTTTPASALHQSAQQKAIAEAQDKLVASLDGLGYRVIRRLTIIPVIDLFVEPDALVVVDRSPLVKWVVEERPWPLLPLSKIPAEVWQNAQTNAVRITVQLNTAVATTPAGALHQPAQRQAIAEAQNKLLISLAGGQYSVTKRLTIIPTIGLEAGIDALAELDRSPLVRWVLKDPQSSPSFPLSKVPVETWQWVETHGVIRLSVTLLAPDPCPSPVIVYMSRRCDPNPQYVKQAYAEAKDKFLASLAGTQYSVIRPFADSLYIQLEVGADALTVLDSSPLVSEIHPLPLPATPALHKSNP